METQTLEEKFKAVIEHDGDEKYIVASVGKGGSLRHVLVSLPIKSHSGIERACRGRLDGEANTMKVLGGGILTLDRDAKTIKTYGQSGSYGKPDVDLIRQILETNFPDYTIDAQVTDYIRC